jgi:hypothetical protein
VETTYQSRDLALAAARVSAPNVLTTWDQSNRVALAQLEGDRFLDLDFQLPVDELEDSTAGADLAFLRLYAQLCKQGEAPGRVQVLAPRADGTWEVIGTQRCALVANGQLELDVTKVVKQVLAAAPKPATKDCRPVQCIKAPCPPPCKPGVPTKVSRPPAKLTLRVQAQSTPREASDDAVPQLVANSMKTEKGTAPGAPWTFPRLRFEMKRPIGSKAPSQIPLP